MLSVGCEESLALPGLGRGEGHCAGAVRRAGSVSKAAQDRRAGPDATCAPAGPRATGRMLGPGAAALRCLDSDSDGDVALFLSV